MLLDAARLGVDEGLQHGITTFADTGDTGAGFDAMLERGVRGISYREVFGPDPAQCGDAMAALTEKVEGMAQRATTLVQAGVSPHAPYTVSDALFSATAAFARERGLPIAVHIAESALESELVEQGSGAFANGLRSRGITVDKRARSPMALLDRLGVLAERPLLIHCVRVDDEDVSLIARHGCAVAHCPASNAKLGHGIAPLAKLLAANIRVGLGTDSVASNDRMDLLDEARLATLFSTARELAHDALSAARALELATIGGARSLGLERDIGTLEVGKSADLAAFPLPSDRAPVADPVASLIYAIAGTRATLTVVAGEVRVREGRLCGGWADAGLPGRVQETANRLQAWLVTRP
jgi:5-methylthioadenosine/S-adenosylhomocysteine deaminase